METVSYRLTLLTIVKLFIPVKQTLLHSVNRKLCSHTRRLNSGFRMSVITIEYPFRSLEMSQVVPPRWMSKESLNEERVPKVPE